MAIKIKYKIKSIDKSQTTEWLKYKHYAKRIPPIEYAFGLFNETNLMQGIVTYSTPVSSNLRGIFNNEFKLMELNRLVINEGLEKNCLSFLVSQSLKMLPTPLVIISYADTSQNHHGYIYQATNWIYTGMTKSRTDKYVEGSKHSRHYNNENQNGLRKYRSAKHRYIYFATSKTKRKEYMKKLNYQIEPYPKGENKKYKLGTFIEPIVIDTNAS